jgi:hypothetical protein
VIADVVANEMRLLEPDGTVRGPGRTNCTVNDAKGDAHRFVDVGVEGYQKSNMVKDGRPDLAFGILVRKIPRRCDTLVAGVLNVGGDAVTSGPITVPTQMAVDEFIDFEDGQPLPAGWATVTSKSGSKTSVSIEAAAAHSGQWGLRCVDNSTTEARPQHAAVTYTLPPGRFEWRAQAWFNPIDLGSTPVNGSCISSAVRVSAWPRASGTMAAHLEPGWWRRSRTTHTNPMTARSSRRAGGAGGDWSSSGWRRGRQPRSCISTKTDE